AIVIYLGEVSGGYSEGETPVPFPNTEVKPFSADGTARETVWESRSSPGYSRKSPRQVGFFSCALLYIRCNSRKQVALATRINRSPWRNTVSAGGLRLNSPSLRLMATTIAPQRSRRRESRRVLPANSSPSRTSISPNSVCFSASKTTEFRNSLTA